MIRSMTAYAGGERVTPWGTLGCELRSVNHRFLEVGTRLPDEVRALNRSCASASPRASAAASWISACACVRRRGRRAGVDEACWPARRAGRAH
jgi:hypothetical protein